MAVVVMIAFARSGGTVLNQCLGSLPDVVIMSEVNPLGGGWGEKGPESLTSIKEQAKHWYQIELKSTSYVDSVIELEQICEKTNRILILRDWTFSNFMPHQVNKFAPPNALLTLEALSGNCDLLSFVFVRDAIDVWISRGMPPAEEFFRSYRLYVNAIKEYPVFKYEDFCREPADTIHKICVYAGIPYAETWRNYLQFRTVHGDVQRSQGSRGVRLGKIQPLPRKRIPFERVREINNCRDMVLANQLLDYPSNYSSVPREKYLDGILARVMGKIETISESIKNE